MKPAPKSNPKRAATALLRRLPPASFLRPSAVATEIDDGCVTINEVKGATRCGMGPCGGRMCEDAVARLIALKTSRTRAQIGMATGRPPLRPVALDAIAGDFDYDALPMPAPAPL